MSPAVAQLFADSAPTELVLADCTQLDAAATGQLLATAGSRRLDRLEMCYCGRGFGDETVVGLVEGVELSGLLELKLTGAYRLSDKGARGGGWGRRGTGAYRLSDKGARKEGEGELSGLLELKLTGAYRLSDKGARGGRRRGRGSGGRGEGGVEWTAGAEVDGGI